MVSNILAGFYVKRLFAPGSEVEVSVAKGVVAAVSTTLTILEHEGRELVLANQTLLSKAATVRRARADM